MHENEGVIRKIVVGVDGSQSARCALDWAWDEALLWNGELHVVHAWEYPYSAGHRITASEPIESAKLDAARLLDAEISLLRTRKTGSVAMHAHLVEGPPADVILREAHDADLVAVGSRGRGELTSLLLGSVAHQVSNHGRCPVVVVRGRRAADKEATG